MTQPQGRVDFSTFSITELSPVEFAAIADYAKSTFGMHLPEAKREMVYARLIKRLRRVGLSSFSAYLDFVKHQDNDAERSEFLSALTTNVTQFFRESHHFDFARRAVLPRLIEKARKGQRVRLWSAGCSAGQEPFSLAMELHALCPQAHELNIKILATDIDPRILQRAAESIYPNDELKAIPQELRASCTLSADEGNFTIAQPIRALVRFGELNLIDEWPMQGNFDIIFCRNVAIYFDAPTQSRLWHRFAQKLTDDGHLFIGHSERLSGPAAEILKSVGVTVYAKKNPQSPK